MSTPQRRSASTHLRGSASVRRACFHTGDNSGYLAVNAWLPDEQITVAVLSNDQATVSVASGTKETRARHIAPSEIR